jgi:hypothetical protein
MDAGTRQYSGCEYEGLGAANYVSLCDTFNTLFSTSIVDMVLVLSLAIFVVRSSAA